MVSLQKRNGEAIKIKEKQMRISAIIPTRDRPQYLAEAVNSVLAQTFPPLEIIIVNNGKAGIDLPEDILVRVIIKNTAPLIGASAARNYGARLAQGDYLAFLDDDDLWNKNYLANAAEAIKRGAGCLLSRMDYIDENGQIRLFKNPVNLINIKNLLTYNPGVSGSNLVVSKNIFFEAGGYDRNLITSEDKSLILEMLKFGINIICLPENQVIINHNSSGLRNPASLAEGIYQFIKKYKNLMSWQQYFFNWYKIYYYRFKAGEKMALLPYFFLTLFFSPKRFFKYK